MCLYCRQEERDAARRRRNRVLARFGLTTLGGSVVIALIVGALVTLSPASRTNPIAVAGPAVEIVPPDAPVQRAPAGAAKAPAPVATKAAAPVVSSLLSPQISPGLRDLGNGMTAERVGDEVTVSFDTDSLRTRFDWKFEGVVRATLPMVFGQPARAALESIEHGSLLEGENLIRTLPRTGVRIPLDNGLGTIRVYPMLRDGRDGPIVAAYRAAVSR